MYRVAICDDNEEFLELFREKFQQYCKQAAVPATLYAFRDSDMLMEQVEEKRGYDAYILDMEMPVHTGLDIARAVRSYSNTAVIIFLTAFESYAREGYGLNVSDYIMKEQMEDGLGEALGKMFLKLSQMKDGKIYTITNQRKSVKLYQKDIVYIYKFKKNAVFVQSDNMEEKERATLQEVYQRLNNPEMVMVDRGPILNLYHIRKIVDNIVLLDNGKELSLSKNSLITLKRYLSSYWEEHI